MRQRQRDPADARPARAHGGARVDLRLIAEHGRSRATRVLDVGCGDGALLHLLARSQGRRRRAASRSRADGRQRLRRQAASR